MTYDWDFSGLAPYTEAFARGAVVTVELSVLSSVAGTLAGLPVAGLLLAQPIIAVPVRVVVEVLRAIPNLVLIFFVYYFPYRQVLGVEAPSGFTAVLIALTAAQAAYSADLIRAAILTTPRDQVLGLRGAGLTKWQIFGAATVPWTIRQTLAAHFALWLGNLKLSSLASVVGVEDAVFVAKVAMAQSFRSLEAWVAVALLYVALALPTAWLFRRIETSRWLQRQ